MICSYKIDIPKMISCIEWDLQGKKMENLWTSYITRPWTLVSIKFRQEPLMLHQYFGFSNQTGGMVDTTEKRTEMWGTRKHSPFTARPPHSMASKKNRLNSSLTSKQQPSNIGERRSERARKRAASSFGCWYSTRTSMRPNQPRWWKPTSTVEEAMYRVETERKLEMDRI